MTEKIFRVINPSILPECEAREWAAPVSFVKISMSLHRSYPSSGACVVCRVVPWRQFDTSCAIQNIPSRTVYMGISTFVFFTTWKVDFMLKIDFFKIKPTDVAVKPMMQPYSRSIHLDYLIGDNGIGGEIAHNMSSKTVIYYLKNTQYNFSECVTVGRLDRAKHYRPNGL